MDPDPVPYSHDSQDTLPPFLMTSEPGSFARRTILERKPQIARRVLAENPYPPAIAQAVERLISELAGEAMRPLTEEAPDAVEWNRELATAWAGRTWLDTSWFFAETFFYRRLLEAVRYLQPGPWCGRDPFDQQKRTEEQAACRWLVQLAGLVRDMPPQAAFRTLLHASLWGNRFDLSHPAIVPQAYRGKHVLGENRNLLVDHSSQVEALLGQRPQRVDFVNDNVGLDLASDLALTDFLLAQGWVRQVVFHLKERPFFVSDAMLRDVETMVATLGRAEAPELRALGRRLAGHLADGHLLLKTGSAADGFFWTSFKGFRRFPLPIRADLAGADLVILKGDANYRRLLDDRHWPFTAPLEEAAGYFPTSFVALRTLKAELIVGLRPGQPEALWAEDPDWLTNAKRGIIQMWLSDAAPRM
jgi:hypothetical protein